MADCVAQLPLPNSEITNFLAVFANEVSTRAAAQGTATMTVFDLSSVLTPLILRHDDEDLDPLASMRAQEDAPYRTQVVQVLLENHREIWQRRRRHPLRLPPDAWEPARAEHYIGAPHPHPRPLCGWHGRCMAMRSTVTRVSLTSQTGLVSTVDLPHAAQRSSQQRVTTTVWALWAARWQVW